MGRRSFNPVVPHSCLYLHCISLPPCLPPSPFLRGDSSKRSSSSSNPTLGSNSGEMYSNLGDLFVGGAFVGESQRRHSFAEGDDKIVIEGGRAR